VVTASRPGRLRGVEVRLLRGLWSLAWLVLLLVGLPAGLVALVGWPLPDHVPSGAELRRWAGHPVTVPVLVNAAACLVWLLWAWLLYAVVVDVLARLRRVVRWLGRWRPPTLGPATPVQAAASGMVGAVVLGLSGGAQAAPMAGGAAEPATVAQPATTTGPAATTAQPSAREPSPDVAGSAAVGDDRGPYHREHQPPTDGGTVLPDGGWLPADTAAAVAATARLVWIQRRRRYLPRPPAGVDRDDADLAPLPATIAAVQARPHRPGEPEPIDDVNTAGAVAASPGPVGPATVGQRAGAPLRPAGLPAGGVGLTGDGAADAARGILTATLLPARPGHPGQQARVITTATDLHTLLGPSTGSGRDVAGLTVAATVERALAELDRAVLTRATATGRLDHDDTPSTARPAPAGAFPPIVVLLAAPPAGQVDRLAVVLRLAAGLGVRGVLLGAWPHGPTWHVAADGTSTPAGQPEATGPRLCVLSPTAAADLLTLLREAHPPQHPPTAPQPPQRAGPTEPHRTALPRPDGSRSGAAHATAPPHDRAAAGVRLRVLGAPAVYRLDGAPQPVPIARSAALQVLVFLAVEPQGATGGPLAKAIWPGTPPRSAAASLYTAVTHLRKALSQATDATVVIRAGEAYRLDPAHIEVDLWRLHAAVAEAATALTPTDRQRALQQVIDAYTGELADTLGWPWLAPHREAIRRHVIDAHADLAATHHDPHAALALLQDGIRVDPYNEELHRQAMRRYAAAGDPTAVRDLLKSLTERLASIGLRPHQDTIQLGGHLAPPA
jgi:DNA-binding SARP family transcriptional activator